MRPGVLAARQWRGITSESSTGWEGRQLVPSSPLPLALSWQRAIWPRQGRCWNTARLSSRRGPKGHQGPEEILERRGTEPTKRLRKCSSLEPEEKPEELEWARHRRFQGEIQGGEFPSSEGLAEQEKLYLDRRAQLGRWKGRSGGGLAAGEEDRAPSGQARSREGGTPRDEGRRAGRVEDTTPREIEKSLMQSCTLR